MPFAESAGVRIFYEQLGGGEPLLLIPGLGSDATIWAAVTPRLAQRYTVVTMHPRGGGRSDAPDVPYSAGSLARDASAVLDAAGAARAHVMGVSMGGMIAQELAIRHPDRVRSLVLVATHARSGEWSRRAFAIRRTVLERCGVRDHLRLSILLVTSPATFRNHERAILAYEARAAGSAQNVAGYLRQMDYCVRHDSQERLQRISVPTLIIAGCNDLLIPPERSRALADGIPGARYYELANASHVLLLECRDAFLDLALPFLEGIHESAGSAPVPQAGSPT